VKTLAVTNQKGGSGKTTTAVNLAAALGERGLRVLLVDLDPQASASTWLGVKDGGRGLLDVFTTNVHLLDVVHQTAAKGVDVVPSSSWLASAEKALAGEPGAELVFRKAVHRLPGRWDYVLVDCPPALGLLTVSALAAVDEVLVPVELSPMALAGVARLVETVDLVRDRLNEKLEVAHILACRVDARTNLARDILQALGERFGDKVLDAVVRESVRIREAWGYGQPVTNYDPAGVGAEDFRSVAAELVKRHAKTLAVRTKKPATERSR
jgi:chromosome partitioning protein